MKDIDASAAVARPAPRASAASVDTVWIHWFWRSAQHEPWHSQETGLNQGLRMVSDGVWRFTVVYVFDVFDVYDVCVWCDWCVLTRTLLWQYDAVWIRAGLYSMAVRRALDMRLAIFSRRSEGLHWSAHIKNRKKSGVFQLLLGQPQACPGYSSLLYSPAVKDIDASAAVARPAPRASAASVDTVWIRSFWRSAQHEPWHPQETGLNQGLRMVSDGLVWHEACSTFQKVSRFAWICK